MFQYPTISMFYHNPYLLIFFHLGEILLYLFYLHALLMLYIFIVHPNFLFLIITLNPMSIIVLINQQNLLQYWHMNQVIMLRQIMDEMLLCGILLNVLTYLISVMLFKYPIIYIHLTHLLLLNTIDLDLWYFQIYQMNHQIMTFKLKNYLLFLVHLILLNLPTVHLLLIFLIFTSLLLMLHYVMIILLFQFLLFLIIQYLRKRNTHFLYFPYLNYFIV